MASVRYDDTNGRRGWRLQTRVNKRPRSMWLGDLSKRAAEACKRHVEELVRANAANVQPSADATRWVAAIDDRIRSTLAGWGLVEPANPKLNTEAGRFLKAYLEAYVASRTDVAEATRRKYRNTGRLLVKFMGSNKRLHAITAADAIRFYRWLKSVIGHADSTRAKHIKRARTMFSELVQDQMLAENPFVAVKAKNEVNRSRDFFISRSCAAKVLDACPDHDWRLIFALARYGGLRRSEIVVITWGDVLWDVGKLRIDSPKTGLRFCPIFPELRSVLDDAFEAASARTKFLTRYRQRSNLGTHMNRIISRAGVDPWPKTFVNLRATRRTELEKQHPHHVVNSWLGHGSEVANRHYLQITDEDWAAAIGDCAGDCISADLKPSGPITETRKARKTRAFDDSGCLEIASELPREDSNLRQGG